MPAPTGLGGLPIHSPPISAPLSTFLLRAAEHTKLYEDQLGEQRTRIGHLQTSLNATTTGAREAAEAKKNREQDVVKWMAHAADQRNEIAAEKTAVADLEGEKQQLQEKVDDLKNEVNGSRAAKSSADTQLAEKSSMVGTLTEEIKVYQARVMDLEVAVQGLEQQRMDKRMSAFMLRNELDEGRETNGELEGEKKELSQKLTDAEARVCAFERQLGDARNANEELQAENMATEEKLKRANDLADFRQHALESLEEARTVLQGEKETAEQELADATAASTHLRKGLEQAERTTAVIEMEKEAAQKKLAEATAEAIDLRADLHTSEAANSQLQTKKTDFERQLSDAENTLTELWHSDAELKTALAEANKVKADLAQQLEQQPQTINKLHGNLQACMKENVDLHALNQQASAKLAAEQVVTVNLQGRLEVYATQIQGFEAEVKRETSRADEATSFFARQQEEMARFLSSSKTGSARLKIVDDDLELHTDGRVKDETFIDQSHTQPVTPMVTQLPSPKTPSADCNRSKDSSPTPSASKPARHDSQQDAEPPCLGSPTSLDPRLRNSRFCKGQGSHQPEQHGEADEIDGPPFKRLCSHSPSPSARR